MKLENLGPRAQLGLDRLPLRLMVLFAGLCGYGASLALLIRSGLGVSPWGVLQVAIARTAGLSVGTVVVVVSFAVLALWWPLRQKPGIGTLANCVCVGVACDVTLAVVTRPGDLILRAVLLPAGILLNGLSSALYIGSQLGPGPRDGLMTGLHRVTGRPIGLLRPGIEVVVLGSGWLLGGPVGIGTALYALCIGPVVQWVLPRVQITTQRYPITAPPDRSDHRTTPTKGRPC
nr:hypothetical protein [Actinopolymorpha cephalotaxi]